MCCCFFGRAGVPRLGCLHHIGRQASYRVDAACVNAGLLFLAGGHREERAAVGQWLTDEVERSFLLKGDLDLRRRLERSAACACDHTAIYIIGFVLGSALQLAYAHRLGCLC